MKSILFAIVTLLSMKSFALSETCIRVAADTIAAQMKVWEPNSAPEVTYGPQGWVDAITDASENYNTMYLSEIYPEGQSQTVFFADSSFVVFVTITETANEGGGFTCIAGAVDSGQNDLD